MGEMCFNHFLKMDSNWILCREVCLYIIIKSASLPLYLNPLNCDINTTKVKPSHTACVTVVQQQRAEYISTAGTEQLQKSVSERAVLDPLLCTGGNTAFTEPATPYLWGYSETWQTIPHYTTIGPRLLLKVMLFWQVLFMSTRQQLYFHDDRRHTHP